MSAEQAEQQIARMDRLIKRSKGESKQAQREALFEARKAMRDELKRAVAGLGEVNRNRRNLGSAAKAARAKEIEEAASPGPRVQNAEAGAQALGPEAQGALRVGTSALSQHLPGLRGPITAWALYKYLESKLTGH